MARNPKQTRSKAASAAGRVLGQSSASRAAKSAAGSALAQAPRRRGRGRDRDSLRSGPVRPMDSDRPRKCAARADSSDGGVEEVVEMVGDVQWASSKGVAWA